MIRIVLLVFICLPLLLGGQEVDSISMVSNLDSLFKLSLKYAKSKDYIVVPEEVIHNMLIT